MAYFEFLVLGPQAASAFFCRRLPGGNRCIVECTAAIVDRGATAGSSGISLLRRAVSSRLLRFRDGWRAPAVPSAITMHHGSSCPGRRIAQRISRTVRRWSAPRLLGWRAVSSTPSELYEQAIRSAGANGFIHNEALANELAARFYAARDFEKIAHVYLQDARYGYLRWGADGKVRQLDEMHAHLRQEAPAHPPAGTIGAPVEHLDLATVIRVSQAVSGEIVLDKLLDTLMRTAIQQAGAERGLLLVPHGAELRIEAEATTGRDVVVVQLHQQPVTAAVLPESVLNYVLRTRDIVILDNAAAEPPFAADPYLQRRRARSILCLPLIAQTKLIGLLYLENNLTSGVFAPGRIAVLKLLASQAAIALENARLYGDLAEREAKIRRLVDANIIGILISRRDGDIVEANDAFLKIVGYDREDLVSGRLRWPALTTPESLTVPRSPGGTAANRNHSTIREGVFPQGRHPRSGIDWRGGIRSTTRRGRRLCVGPDRT